MALFGCQWVSTRFVQDCTLRVLGETKWESGHQLALGQSFLGNTFHTPPFAKGRAEDALRTRATTNGGYPTQRRRCPRRRRAPSFRNRRDVRLK